MRQLLVLVLSVGALAAFGQTPAQSLEAIANKRVEQARQELQKITQLVEAGAVARVRLDQAQQDLEDAQDELVLARTLYGDPLSKDLNSQLAEQMIAAAQRRVDRQQQRLDQARKLIDAG